MMSTKPTIGRETQKETNTQSLLRTRAHLHLQTRQPPKREQRKRNQLVYLVISSNFYTARLGPADTRSKSSTQEGYLQEFYLLLTPAGGIFIPPLCRKRGKKNCGIQPKLKLLDSVKKTNRPPKLSKYAEFVKPCKNR